MIPLWPETPPGGGGPSGALHINKSGSRSNIVCPSIQRFQPGKPNGEAVLIAAGGGYCWIGMGREAAGGALAERLRLYHLCVELPAARRKWHAGPLAALQDAQRAIRLVRTMENRVHALGFSAGAHLLGMAAARPDYATYAPQDELDAVAPSVDSVGLIYPVITLRAPYNHTVTHRMLAGRHATPEQEAQWSIENFVTPAYPPTFRRRRRTIAFRRRRIP